MALNAGDRVVYDRAVEGTILATGLEMDIINPDGSHETITEGVLFRPDGSEESHLMHESSFAV